MNSYHSLIKAKQELVESNRINPLYMIAICLLLGLLAGCPSATGPSLGANADLEDLTLSTGILSPIFNANTLNYSAPIVANSVNSITVTATVADSGATLQVQVNDGGWQGCTSGSPSPSLSLDVGDNTVEVRVTAEDVAITKTYSVAVERVGAHVKIVSDDLSDDFTTIQEAIDATSDGDTILVRPDTYTENITFPTDRSITLRSTHGADSTTIDGDSNGAPVVTFPASDESMELDGFTITNGNNTNMSWGGGGIDILESSPRIKNCIISGNSSMAGGGGICCYNASPTIINCSFLGNSVPLFIGIGGGGIFNYNKSSPTVTDCTFEGNITAGEGGGMHNSLESKPTVTNCTFSENEADTGGGMYNIKSTPTVINCSFSENTTTNRGGGMHNDDSSPIVSMCSFYRNRAGGPSGSGMSNDNYSSPTVTNCIFYKNHLSSDGGQEMKNEAYSTPTVTNCTFLSTSDRAIYNANSSPIITNCIVWGYIFDMIWDSGTSSSVVTYTNVPPGGFPMGGTGNIYYEDPLFVDEANGDLHLQPSSPCIDAGDNSAPALPTTDIDGNARIINGTVDMGADEYSP
jgi:hypothetical protein